MVRRLARKRGKLTDPAWRRALPHGADQDDDGAQVDLGAEKAHRRWCDSLSAAVAIAAEAQSDALFLGYLMGCRVACGDSWPGAGVRRKDTLACGSPRKILVDGKKEHQNLALRGKS